jgi:CrcB protein
VKWVLLFVGGGLGAMSRFGVALVVGQRLPGVFPWGTLVVNLVGCFAIGVLATLADEGELFSPSARLFLVSGLLGGFTTFSTFGLETLQLIEARELGHAVSYGLASVVLGLAAVLVGVFSTRSLL